MIIEREVKGNIYSKPIIKQEHIEFINKKYKEGLSQIDISKIMQVSPSLISKIMKENNIKIRTDREQALKYKCNEMFFNKIDTEEKAYWLGFMYADGYIQNKRKHSNYKIGITLSEVDKKHLEKFNESLSSDYEIKTYEQSETSYGGAYSKLIISSERLALDLMNKVCILKKTDKLKYPNDNIVPKELKIHFIRGYIDGDGSVGYSYVLNSKNGKRDKFEMKLGIVGTKEILEGILNEFGLSHLKLDKRRKDRNNNNYQINIGGNKQTIELLDKLYGNCNIYLDRKYEKYLEIKERYKQYLVELTSNS